MALPAKPAEALVARFIEAVNDRDVERLMALMSDDLAYHVPFRTDSFPAGGIHSKVKVGAMLADLLGGLAEFRMTAVDTLSDGDRVVVRAVGQGVGRTGAPYQNAYSLHFRIAGGHIREVHEFMDPFELIEYSRRARDPKG